MTNCWRAATVPKKTKSQQFANKSYNSILLIITEDVAFRPVNPMDPGDPGKPMSPFGPVLPVAPLLPAGPAGPGRPWSPIGPA